MGSVSRKVSSHKYKAVDWGRWTAPVDCMTRFIEHMYDIEIDAQNEFTAERYRTRRVKKAAGIARFLLHVMIREIDRYGLLQDYIGYPYRSGARDSAWDDKRQFGLSFCMGHDVALFPMVEELLIDDLTKRGFTVHYLRFTEEQVQRKLGIGLAWSIDY